MSSDSTGVTAYWMARDGSISEDPAGRFGRRSDDLYQSATTPVLVGPDPLYYDAAQRRWLPVGRQSVSPDGSQYAYVKPFTTTIHVVTVATGQESGYLVPRGPWHILDFTAEGLYLNQEWEGVGTGLWKLDLRTSGLRKVLSDRTVTFVTTETAWVWDVDPSAPASFSAFAGASVPNRISRLDLRSGALTNWVTTVDAVPNVIGFDIKGSPFIVASGRQESAVELVPAPNHVVKVTTYPVGPGGPVFQPRTAIADASGAWLGGPDGLYRYDASGFHRVAATGKVTDPANRCV
ncbi:MAG TPA: hypothetical protein VKI99_16610 [Candidatus Dormibacteraeota bacterium]|nr:hypothetical protein [Candidatus Dormibacteraeota bacterium]